MFGGPALVSDDKPRLNRQLAAVREIMADGGWRTITEIKDQMEGNPTTQSISARLRDLRKPRFGGYLVERRRIAPGLFAYRVDMQRQNPAKQSHRVQHVRVAFGSGYAKEVLYVDGQLVYEPSRSQRSVSDIYIKGYLAGMQLMGWDWNYELLYLDDEAATVYVQNVEPLPQSINDLPLQRMTRRSA